MSPLGPPPAPRDARVATTPSHTGANARSAQGGEDSRALLARAQRGDRDAFDALAVRTLPRLLGTARRLGANAADAEEAVAEALFRAYRKLPRFRGDARFETWCHRILCRVVVDRFRSRGREETRRERLRRRPEPEPAVTPLARLAADEEGARLRAAVEELPELQRLVVVLHAWEGLALHDVADLLGTPYATVKSNLHHARESLRRRLGPAEGAR
jgi:RNA polymerase sigma-70 factor (ECF subfamily)